TGPSHAAVTPDSNPPNSFDVSMNTPFTADTRPRIASGVRSWTSVWRTTTLMLSNPPASSKSPIESANDRDNPKPIVAAPNPATAITNAPIDGAARSHPNPAGPTCKMSFAKIGSSVVAPPKSTANRSSVIAARITFVRHTYTTPATRFETVMAFDLPV